MGVHPAGVLPNGNALLLPSADARALHARKTAGLGALAALDDALLLSVFDRFTHDDDGAKTLAALASTSKACRAFATHEDLWKSLTLNAYGGKFTFRGQSWLATFRAAREARTRKRPREDEKEEKDRRTIQCEIFSDVLHQRYMCAAMDVESEWVAEASTVPEATSTMSVDEFRAKYESLNIPVVIRGAAKNWPAMKKWTRQALVRKFGAIDFTVGGYEMALKDFFACSDGCSDDTPLYLFDPLFGEKAPELANDYTVPEYFARDDLFKLLSDDRPHYRWLIVGPSKSGSIFHKDPNATSAWNACITGRKRWIMFKPNQNPPGVYPSADGAEVAQPHSLVEWFTSFYEFANKEGALECVCEPGDVLFVPSGWWHMALNLTECIAITQNYVSVANLPKVLDFLDTKCENLVSGLDKNRRGGLSDRFVAALRASGDDALLAVVDAHARKKTSATQKAKSIIGDAFATASASSFSFSF